MRAIFSRCSTVSSGSVFAGASAGAASAVAGAAGALGTSMRRNLPTSSLARTIGCSSMKLMSEPMLSENDCPGVRNLRFTAQT
jgi:purine-cytosine permease-like protein